MNIFRRFFISGLLLLVVFYGSAFAETVKVNAKINSISGGQPANTGVNVTKGDLLVISVDANQKWSAGTASNLTSNANGLNNPIGGNLPLFRRGDFAFLYGSLIGSIDGGKTFFPVGTNLTMPILTKRGSLQLYYWDINKADNKGSVKVIINTYRLY